MEKLVSIVIPTFNRAKLVEFTINSVLDQTYKHWEMLIVDDGSNDNTDQIVAPFLKDSRIKFYNRPKDRPGGGNAARNFGFEMAQGSFIKWLDSDDLITPNCLEVQLTDIEKNNSDVTFCRSKFFEQESKEIKIKIKNYWHPKFPDNNNYLENFILGKIRFSNNDGLWRKSFFKERPYEEKLKNSQEYLMISLALAGGASVSLQNEVLVLIRQHDNSMKDHRSYADFAKNQCLARFLVVRGLKKNNIRKHYLYNFLIKSMVFYCYTQLKKGEFSNVYHNTRLIAKAISLTI